MIVSAHMNTQLFTGLKKASQKINNENKQQEGTNPKQNKLSKDHEDNT